MIGRLLLIFFGRAVTRTLPACPPPRPLPKCGKKDVSFQAFILCFLGYSFFRFAVLHGGDREDTVVSGRFPHLAAGPG